MEAQHAEQVGEDLVVLQQDIVRASVPSCLDMSAPDDQPLFLLRCLSR